MPTKVAFPIRYNLARMRKQTFAAPSRRGFLAAAAAAAASSCSQTDDAPATPADAWSPRVSENIGDLDDATLAWMAQLGLEHVVLQGTDWVDRDAKGYWSAADIKDLHARCGAFGLRLHSLMIPIAWLTAPMLGDSTRDDFIANINRSVKQAGDSGVEMIEWRWSPDFKWGADVGYYETPGRGGAVYKAFDFASVADAPPFPDVGRIARQDLWDRLIYFAEGVMPAAEQAGVKMSLHPKDPPVKSMRGVDRLLTDADEIEAFLDAVDSPANGFTFCQGTVTEMGVDVIDAIRRIGGRNKIHHVHFRAVRGQVPRYVETFIDEGDVDMLEAMRAYKQVDYRGSLVSDHTPRITGDFAGGRVGRSFSHGYIRGLIQAANA